MIKLLASGQDLTPETYCEQEYRFLEEVGDMIKLRSIMSRYEEKNKVNLSVKEAEEISDEAENLFKEISRDWTLRELEEVNEKNTALTKFFRRQGKTPELYENERLFVARCSRCTG